MPFCPLRPGPLAVAAALALGACAAQAQSPAAAAPFPAPVAVEVRIAAQPLGQALDALARQTRLELMLQPALVAGKPAPALSGRFTAREAFERLLAGSGLVADIEGAIVTLRPAPPPPAPARPAEGAALASVTVTASADRLTTEQTGSYTTRALTIGKLEQSIRETPQSVTVVTRQQMDDQNLSTIEDVIAQTTGTSKSQRNFGSHVYMLRGYEISDTNYLIDGVSGASYSPTGWVPTDTAVFDRVEILRGAGAIVAGAGDPSGVVNQVRKRPRDERHVDVAFSLGSWQNYRTEIDTGGPVNADGSVRARLVAAYQDRAYFYDVAHSTEPLFYGVADADLGQGTRATVGLRRQALKIDGYSIFNLPRFSNGAELDIDRSTSFAQRWNRHEATVSEVFGELEQHHGQGWRSKITVNRNLTGFTQKLATARGAVDPATLTGTSITSLYFNARNLRSSGFDANLSGSFQAFGATHQAVFGADASDMRYLDQSTTIALNIPVDVYHFNHELLPEPVTPAYANRAQQSLKRRSLYANARLELARPLHLLLGARLNRYAYRSQDLVSGALTSDYRENGHLTPYVGLVYDLDRRWSVYGSYASTFVPQSQYANSAGSALKPAIGANYEAGLKGELMDGRLNLAFALFHIRKHDVAVLDTEHLGQCPGVTTTDCYRNADLLISQGLDAEVAGEIAPGWQLAAGYTHLKTRDPSGAPLSADTPEHMLRLATSVRLREAWSRWTLGGALSAQTDSYVQTNAVNPGRAILDLRAAYQIDPRWSASLNLGNVADKRYLAIIGGTRNGNAFGTPRNLSLTLRGSF